jgi:hypothetical protein
MRIENLSIWNSILPKIGLVEYNVKWVEQRPRENDITAKTIFIVGTKKNPKWAMMKCPCGCGDSINICLMKGHYLNWKIGFDKLKRISFSPSIRKLDNCKSHFFIIKGSINWV